jgi:hypothetical protein
MDRVCKKCKSGMVMVIVENHKAPLTFYKKERLDYCDDCWETEQFAK